ncbi:MAG: hypothetical protein P4L99_07610 [Chthoniobacter sp.]|nr:hypothetical protein [Chthoniobacter sp.]
MKTKLFYSALLAAALSAGVARADDKTLGEKTSDALEKAKDKTIEAGRVVAEDTKKAATTVKDAVLPDSDARKVDVTLTERRIEMDRELPPGKTAFVVRNNGKERQNFKIEGNGLDKEFMIAVAPNDTKTLHVDLKRGDYKVFVPSTGNDSEPKGSELSLRVK